jgi:hypothetical protein
MGNYALVFPVPAGTSDDQVKSIAKAFKADAAAYQESRKRAGVTLERVYLQKTPMGNIVIAYVEGAKDFGSTVGAYLSSDLPIDGKFVDLIKQIHGVDLRQPPAGPPPETLAQWWDPSVKTRRRGFGFTAPVAPGKTDAGRAFAKEAYERRVAEFATSRQALRLNGEVVTLQSTPMGDLINVYLEGIDPVASNVAFAASTSAYDKWFKDASREIFPPFVDFNKPVVGVEEFFDSEALAAVPA